MMCAWDAATKSSPMSFPRSLIRRNSIQGRSLILRAITASFRQTVSPLRRRSNTLRSRVIFLPCVLGNSTLRALRYHRECNAFGAGVARQDHHRNQQYDAPARENLLWRRHRADHLFPRRRSVQSQLRRQEGQVSGSEGSHLAVRRRQRTAAPVLMTWVGSLTLPSTAILPRRTPIHSHTMPPPRTTPPRRTLFPPIESTPAFHRV